MNTFLQQQQQNKKQKQSKISGQMTSFQIYQTLERKIISANSFRKIKTEKLFSVLISFQ
jgi:hypothetical protein